MKSIRSFADVVRDWEQLLEAVNDNSEALATATAEQKAVLEETLVALRAKKARQESCAASRQQATQDLHVLIAEGSEMARRLRGVVRAVLGSKSEQLVQFRVAPLRSRRRSKPVVPSPGDQTVTGPVR